MALLRTGKTRQSTLSVSLNNIGESRCPVHFGPRSDADTLAPQALRCSGCRLQGDQAVYRAFIDWIAEMSRQKGKQKSHQTCKNYWKWLNEYCALHIKKKMNGNV